MKTGNALLESYSNAEGSARSRWELYNGHVCKLCREKWELAVR